MLGNSQGFYQRLYNKLSDGTIESSNFLIKLENMRFDDIVDLILYLENG